MHGLQIFKLYDDLKVAYPDIDKWEAESIALEVPHIEEADDIIPAVSLCENTREPWEDLLVFQKLCLLINGRLVFFDVEQNLTIREIAYAVSIIKQRYPNELFNDEVSKYIATEAIEEGFVVLPEVISFAQRYIPNYFISPEQEPVQMAYINEANNYIDLMNSNIANVGDMGVGN